MHWARHRSGRSTQTLDGKTSRLHNGALSYTLSPASLQPGRCAAHWRFPSALQAR